MPGTATLPADIAAGDTITIKGETHTVSYALRGYSPDCWTYFDLTTPGRGHHVAADHRLTASPGAFRLPCRSVPPPILDKHGIAPGADRTPTWPAPGLLSRDEARELARTCNRTDCPPGKVRIAQPVPAGAGGGSERGWIVGLVPMPQRTHQPTPAPVRRPRRVLALTA